MTDLRLVGIVLLLSSIASSCRCNRPVDGVTARLELIGKHVPPQADVHVAKERTQTALSLWHNGVIDHTPVIFYAILIYPSDCSNALWVSMFDEDKDIVGIGIREEHVGEDRQPLVREEQYPVYAHTLRLSDEVLDESIVPVHIRQEGQEMDIRRWTAYARAEGDDLLRNWGKMLPPIWVSPPDSTEVKVEVYAYDQAGHTSMPLRLGVWHGAKAH